MKKLIYVACAVAYVTALVLIADHAAGDEPGSPDGIDYQAAAIETCEYRLDAMQCYMQMPKAIKSIAKQMKVSEDCAAFIAGVATIATHAMEMEDTADILKAARCECDDPAPCNDVRT